MGLEPADDHLFEHFAHARQNCYRSVVFRIKLVSFLEQWRYLGEFPAEWKLIMFEALVHQMSHDAGQRLSHILYQAGRR